ncbi:MAG: flagellar motor switch protein FliN [Nitrospinae bacterium]|nr:flagellar motor switch protein FliN [Nitrospinota bacterium]
MVNQFEDLEAPAEEKRDTEAAAAISDIKVKATRDMDLLLDIPLNVKAELGRTKMSIKEILKLKIGTVVELAKLVGEPMEVYINGLLIARGEVVVVNEKFGIRITDVIDPLEVRRLAI